MTLKLAIFGNPVEHSLSPVLHTYFGKQAGIDVSYERILVPEGGFAAAADSFFASGGAGCNVTVPCKQDAFAYAGECTERARKAAASNALKKLDGGGIFADNTDGAGLVEDLRSLGTDFPSCDVLVIGAGGAAMGILDEIWHERPRSITVTNRTLSNAQKLASQFGYIKVIPQEEVRGSYGLVLNASSSSLHGVLPEIDESVLAGAGCVYDLMYSRDGTTVLTEKARALGAACVHDGIGMLVCQAVLSFRLWTGADIDIPKAKDYLRGAIAQKGSS